jgi:hypothetical protein
MSSGNWKTWIGVALAVGLLVLVAVRLRLALHDRPPDWLRQEDKHSAKLAEGSLKKFRAFRKETEFEAQQAKLPVGSIQFFEISADGKVNIVWNTVRLANQGFNPLADFDQWGGDDERRLLGFYTLDGEPVGFTVKHHPSRPHSYFLVVHLPKPLAPGESTLVLRVERRPLSLKTNAKGQTQFGLGRLNKPTTAVHARGLSLPERARLEQYRPEKGAFEFTGHSPMIGWINSCLDSNFPPLNATFTLSR